MSKEPRTPQGIGGKRFIFDVQKRRNLVTVEAADHRAAIRFAAQVGAGQPRAANVLATAETQLGLRYAISGCRCSPSPCYARDCSGLICFALNSQPGWPYICTSSFSFAEMGRAAGTLVDEQTAIHTPGAVGIRCGFCDPNFNGSNGHIVFFKGDGQTTVEEGGHATGCYRGQAQGRGFDAWMLIPGVDYSTSQGSEEEPMLFLDRKHPSAKANRTRSASVQPDGTIWLGNGANLKDAQPQWVNNIRTVIPPSGGAKYAGAWGKGDQTGFVIQFVQGDGSFADFNYTFVP